MTQDGPSIHWQTDGKFLRSGSSRVFPLCVTYGPFPGGWPDSFDADFARITAAGFHALRIYQMPEPRLLDAARQHGLRVFAGFDWAQNVDFLRQPRHLTAATIGLVAALRATGGHPALAGVYVGNEIPPDLVRWMGPARVREALETLISHGRESAPHLMFAYANFPGTEYLEPENADFTAFNLYLEDEPPFRRYVKRLHHIAGDRPLVISEFGLDTRRNGTARQAGTLRWALAAARELEVAAMTVYAWSDRWWNNNAAVTDWDFGLTDREGVAKPALTVMTAWTAPPPPPPAPPSAPFFSVIIASRNGRHRIASCLRAVERLTGRSHETIVVDDGSSDGMAERVAREFPDVRLIRLPPSGLSAARNAGAAAACGQVLAFTDDDCEPDAEWLVRLRRVLDGRRFAAVGGPNLPPPPTTPAEAIVTAAPGGPSHVLLDDEEAEHLPGCNLAVRRDAFDAIGGFDPQFHTAGDDVDFCWRLSEAGYALGFAPGAFVWHHRRPTLGAFLRQQAGYGRAERLLMAKHPTRFSTRGGAKWRGFVYGGGPVRATGHAVIYHGPLGHAGYQSLVNRVLPLRGLPQAFDRPSTRCLLHVVAWLVPRIRSWHRTRSLRQPTGPPPQPQATEPLEIQLPATREMNRDTLLQRFLDDGWSPCGNSTGWDLERAGSRVLIATEYGQSGPVGLLIRIDGDPTTLPRALKNP